MRSLCRRSLALAAAVSVSAVMWTAGPASAADRPTDRISAQEVAKPAPPKHRVVRRTVHRAAWAPVVNDYSCSSIWCGRQFVLMLGIGY